MSCAAESFFAALAMAMARAPYQKPSASTGEPSSCTTEY